MGKKRGRMDDKMTETIGISNVEAGRMLLVSRGLE